MTKIFIVFIALISMTKTAVAETWYVRPDGGTITQCTGLADAPYPGSGTNQACAVSHPYWLFNLDGNGGGSTASCSAATTITISGGSAATNCSRR